MIEDPKSDAAYRQMAEIYREQKKYAEAIQAHDKIKAIEPKDTLPYLAIAEVYKEMGRLDEALAELKKASEAVPSDPISKLKMIEVHEGRKDYSSALGLMREMAKTQPNNVELAMNIPRLMLLAGQTDNAIAEYQRLLNENPGEERLYVRLAEAYEQDGQLDKAIETYQRFPKRGPVDEAWVHSRVASVHARQGKLDEAIAGYKWVLERFPDADKHYFEILELEKQRGKVDEAVSYLTDRVLNGVDRDAPVEALVAAYDLSGLTPTAVVARLRRLHRARPTGEAIANQTVEYCVRHRLDKETIRAIRALLEINPDAAEWRVKLARLYDASGQTARALRELEMVADKMDSDPDVQLLLGQTLEKSGRRGEAIKAYERAFQLDSLEAKKALDRLTGKPAPAQREEG